MLFSSLTFLYAFLPLCLSACLLSRSLRQQNAVLLVFSLVFYTWGEPVYVLLLMGMSLADWFFAIRIEMCDSYRGRRRRLAAAVAVNLALIGFFKYSGLAASFFGEVPEFIKNLALPLGISFYTFQLLSYVVDVYRGDAVAQRSYLRVLLYAALFHQCIAGPIVRYKTISRELFGHREARPYIAEGVKRFAWGLGKKVLLGNACGELAAALTATDAAQLAAVPVAGLWLAAAAYMLHIYLDFSGYSDMAIGLGLMLGLHYPENFDHPYASRSVTEFWRRWHMSLSAFFRDYVYIPLGGSRRGIPRTLLNLFIVWSLTGLWHGASITFVLWGVYYFVFLALEKLFLGKWLKRLPSALSWLYTALVVFFGWVIFRFTEPELLITALRGMFGLNGNPLTSFQVGLFFENRVFILLASALVCAPWLGTLGGRIAARCGEKAALSRVWSIFTLCVVPAAILLLSTAMLVGGSYNPFIYFHF